MTRYTITLKPVSRPGESEWLVEGGSQPYTVRPNPSDLIVCAWGGLGTIRDRGRIVRDTLIQAGERLHAIEIGKGGFPKHPLYLKGGLRPVVFGK